jgi:lipopolysaccharide transport system ATP-binding protein
MSPLIEVDRLGKMFKVPGGGMRSVSNYKTLRDDIRRWAGRFSPARLWGKGQTQTEYRDFWALKNLSFNVGQGEVVGIIGPNGAGKSTLLKILSRISKPTEGKGRLRGRVGSLLEVGTGFHPELTGRENIYLNGAILGMHRGEIQSKFDRIVDFADIGPFLDMPVKRYSSGMYVRLAFAVAAHLEPEILIVDEVLAVGDLAFQRKCLGRMHDVGKSGTTILFVSHNMPAVESLCTRAILLDKGAVVKDGGVRPIIQEYYRRVLESQAEPTLSLATLETPGRVLKVFQSATILDAEGQGTNVVSMGGAFRIRLELHSEQPLDFPTITLGFDDNMGHRILSVQNPKSDAVLERVKGRHVLECLVPMFPLAPGDYWLKLGLAVHDDELDEIERALHFTVTEGDAFGDGRGFHCGVCVAPSRWQVTE